MIKQLKVKLENRPGELRHLVGALASGGINIRALEVTERGDGKHGIAHMIVSNLQGGMKVLDEGAFNYQICEVLAVEMDDRAGGLSQVLEVLSALKINIQYLYAFVGRIDGMSLAVFSVDDMEAAKTLSDKGELQTISGDTVEQETQSFKISPGDHFGKDFIW